MKHELHLHGIHNGGTSIVEVVLSVINAIVVRVTQMSRRLKD